MGPGNNKDLKACSDMQYDGVHFMQAGSMVWTWTKTLDFHLEDEKESQKNFKQRNDAGGGGSSTNFEDPV